MGGGFGPAGGEGPDPDGLRPAGGEGPDPAPPNAGLAPTGGEGFLPGGGAGEAGEGLGGAAGGEGVARPAETTSALADAVSAGRVTASSDVAALSAGDLGGGLGPEGAGGVPSVTEHKKQVLSQAKT